jgi:predicted NBD/HSP70 family sugar kinase
MQEKADSELVRRQNRRIVLRALRDKGPLARVELGRMTGLSPASITTIAAQLITESVLEEVVGGLPLATAMRRGRPMTRLRFRSNTGHVLAVNISIDRVGLALADLSGLIVERSALHVPTYDAKPAQFGEIVADKIEQFMAAIGRDMASVNRIGIAIQGLADMHDGILLWSPAFAARNIPLAEPLRSRFNVPCWVANDANMIAEGFLSLDTAERSLEPVANRPGITATIFTGYGVGMGLILGGKVYHGATGGACEFGHMNHIPHGAPCRCGRRGCIEAYAADYGIWRMARGNTDDDAPRDAIDRRRMDELLTAAQQGEPRAVAAFKAAGEALGFGIARLIAILNPHRVVIAGPGLSASKIIQPALLAGVADGVIEELRKNVAVEFVHFETDMILRGTIDALLREVDGAFTVNPPSGVAVHASL